MNMVITMNFLFIFIFMFILVNHGFVHSSPSTNNSKTNSTKKNYSSQSHSKIINPTVSMYWNATLGSTNLLQLMQNIMSPLSALDENVFLLSIQSKELSHSPRLADSFCHMAGLLCDNLDNLNGESTDSLHLLTLGDFLSRSADYRTNIFSPNPLSSQAQLIWFPEADLFPRRDNNYRALEWPSTRFSDELNVFKRSFLPRPLSQALGGLTSTDLPIILDQLHISKTSTMAYVMRTLISSLQINQVPLVYEIISVIASMEDMADFLKKIFMENNKLMPAIKLLRSSSFPANDELIKMGHFKVVDVKLESDVESRSISCHSPLFPYRLEWCHYLPKTRIYSATLQSTSKQHHNITNIVTCHTDTSEWNVNSEIFTILGGKPGEDVFCHWSEIDGFTFVIQQ